jgi:hypothetical protein
MNAPARPARALAFGVAGGLLLMAIFTVWWASDTFTGWPTPVATTVAAICGAAAITFGVQAVRLFGAGSRFSTDVSESDNAKKPNSALFGAVFAAEGVLIGIAAGVLGSTGLDRFMVPTIAIIVGLHFYPMAHIFGRSIDLWLATWTTLVGVVGVTVILFNGFAWPIVWSWVGAGAAAATISYGVYMTRYAQQLLRSAAVATSEARS